jgi:hypothetical protein
LQDGTDEQRRNWRMAVDGESVLWPELHEGVKASDLLRGAHSAEGQSSRADG